VTPAIAVATLHQVLAIRHHVDLEIDLEDLKIDLGVDLHLVQAVLKVTVIKKGKEGALIKNLR